MTNTISALEEISLQQLKPGMYVVSIINPKKQLKIKSEGYILNNATITKLENAGIERVIVDPSKAKKAETIDRIMPDIAAQAINKPKTLSPAQVSLEQEMPHASKLYNDAKSLQQKIVDSLSNGKQLDSEEIMQSTGAIVDSIFRNQDALSCMSRLRNKGSYLIEHSLNVCILMTIFAKQLMVNKATIEQLALGAFVHDIGKIMLPDHILNKTGKLTAEEFDLIKGHVNAGIKFLEETPNISHIAMCMVKEHHERLDGSGYPNQLSQEEISKYGRMIAIVDSYDAMTAERIHKPSIHPIQAFKKLVNKSPSCYDEELVEQFIQCLGIYPVGTLVKLNSGKLGLISKLNPNKPLHPFVRVFYNTRLNQAIPMEEINLSQSKYKDQIDCCIKPKEFNLNLFGFFKAAFLNG